MCLTKICIPRMSANISRDHIFKVFCKIKWGYIEKITEIPLKNNSEYKRVLIRLKWNLHIPEIRQLHERIINQQPVFLVYDMPWYWKIVECK